MNLQDLISSYQFSDHLYLWLAAAFLLGLLIGIVWGRAIGTARARRDAEKPGAPEKDATAQMEVPVAAEVAAAPPISTSMEPASTESASSQPSPTEPAPSEPAEAAGPLISDLVGIQEKHVNKLVGIGIESITDLLAATADRKQRESLADQLQLEDFVIHKWARMAQLLGIPELSPQVAEFLVFAGINTLEELASRNPESLAHKLQHLNEKEHRIDEVPSRQQVEAWMAYLKSS